MSRTSIEPSPSKLYQMIDLGMHDTEIVAVERKTFNDVTGLAIIKQLGLQDHTETLIPGLSSKCFFQFQTIDGIMLIDPVTVRNLELVYNLKDRKSRHSLFGVLNQTQTPMGSRLLRMMILQPLFDQPTIETRLDAVQELVENPRQRAKIQEALKGVLDIDHLISSLIQFNRKQSVKHAEQAINRIIVLKHILCQIQPIHAALQGSKSALLEAVQLVLGKPTIQTLLDVIDQVINTDVTYQKTAIGLRNQRCYAVRSGVNGLLDVARQTYKEATNDVHDLVGHYTEKYGLPVKAIFTPAAGLGTNESLPAEYINASKKRKHLTFTTLRLMSQNGRIQESLTEVYLMGDKIIADLTARARDNLSILYQLSESVALLDAIVGFACAADGYKGVRPEFTSTLAIKNGRHPILPAAMKTTAGPIVSNDVYADTMTRLQIITGPNMVIGQVDVLRQVALLNVLAQIGAYAPAEYASVRLADRLFSRIGTDDSIEASASTFMCEMTEAAFILSNVTDRSLVVIDELGRGTSTTDGVGTKAFVFLVTHFEELAVAFSDTSHAVAMHLQASGPTSNGARSSSATAGTAGAAAGAAGAGGGDLMHGHLTFSYKVLPGRSETQHYGLRLAATAGLDAATLERALRVSQSVERRREQLRAGNAQTRQSERAKTRQAVARAVVQTQRCSTLGDAALRQHLLHLQEAAMEARAEAAPVEH
ncbi:muts domain V-domain-containing protein [Entophlyctis helioformis]|nr:muts domain V-domain-containing protein [Entophlyctis helioformis]